MFPAQWQASIHHQSLPLETERRLLQSPHNWIVEADAETTNNTHCYINYWTPTTKRPPPKRPPPQCRAPGARQSPIVICMVVDMHMFLSNTISNHFGSQNGLSRKLLQLETCRLFNSTQNENTTSTFSHFSRETFRNFSRGQQRSKIAKFHENCLQSHLTIERFVEKRLGSPVFDIPTFETTSVEDRPFLCNMKFAKFWPIVTTYLSLLKWLVMTADVFELGDVLSDVRARGKHETSILPKVKGQSKVNIELDHKSNFSS